jgi:hypothetical protein
MTEDGRAETPGAGRTRGGARARVCAGAGDHAVTQRAAPARHTVGSAADAWWRRCAAAAAEAFRFSLLQAWRVVNNLEALPHRVGRRAPSVACGRAVSSTRQAGDADAAAKSLPPRRQNANRQTRAAPLSSTARADRTMPRQRAPRRAPACAGAPCSGGMHARAEVPRARGRTHMRPFRSMLPLVCAAAALLLARTAASLSAPDARREHCVCGAGRRGSGRPARAGSGARRRLPRRRRAPPPPPRRCWARTGSAAALSRRSHAPAALAA